MYEPKKMNTQIRHLIDNSEISVRDIAIKMETSPSWLGFKLKQGIDKEYANEILMAADEVVKDNMKLQRQAAQNVATTRAAINNDDNNNGNNGGDAVAAVD